jgi:hypothetical protein
MRDFGDFERLGRSRDDAVVRLTTKCASDWPALAGRHEPRKNGA